MPKEKTETEPAFENVVNVPDLEVALKVTIMCASKDDTRPHISAVHFEAEPEKLRMVATDGHRLVVVVLPLRDQSHDWTAALHLAEMKRLAANLRSLPKKERTGKLALQPFDSTEDSRHGGPGDVGFGRLGVFKSTGKKFPPWRKGVPPRMHAKETVCTGPYGLAAGYLKDAAEVFIALHGKMEAMVWQPPSQALDPLRFDSAPNDDNVEATYVQMPMCFEEANW